jgi:hypothetical protein
MIKKILIVIGVIVLGIGIYYGRYFVFDTEVNEEPLMQNDDLQIEKMPIQLVGSFTDVDLIHKGEGRALLIENGNETIVRFENFEVTNGPDLYVWLTKSDQPTSKIESLGDYIDLGQLKGNIGNQNYTTDKNVDEYDTVVIWCKQFSQLFTYANLK